MTYNTLTMQVPNDIFLQGSADENYIEFLTSGLFIITKTTKTLKIPGLQDALLNCCVMW